jgi:hypothetical protein
MVMSSWCGGSPSAGSAMGRRPAASATRAAAMPSKLWGCRSRGQVPVSGVRPRSAKDASVSVETSETAELDDKQERESRDRARLLSRDGGRRMIEPASGGGYITSSEEGIAADCLQRTVGHRSSGSESGSARNHLQPRVSMAELRSSDACATMGPQLWKPLR